MLIDNAIWYVCQRHKPDRGGFIASGRGAGYVLLLWLRLLHFIQRGNLFVDYQLLASISSHLLWGFPLFLGGFSLGLAVKVNIKTNSSSHNNSDKGGNERQKDCPVGKPEVYKPVSNPSTR